MPKDEALFPQFALIGIDIANFKLDRGTNKIKKEGLELKVVFL